MSADIKYPVRAEIEKVVIGTFARLRGADNECIAESLSPEHAEEIVRILNAVQAWLHDPREYEDKAVPLETAAYSPEIEQKIKDNLICNAPLPSAAPMAKPTRFCDRDIGHDVPHSCSAIGAVWTLPIKEVING